MAAPKMACVEQTRVLQDRETHPTGVFCMGEDYQTYRTRPLDGRACWAVQVDGSAATIGSGAFHFRDAVVYCVAPDGSLVTQATRSLGTYTDQAKAHYLETGTPLKALPRDAMFPAQLTSKRGQLWVGGEPWTWWAPPKPVLVEGTRGWAVQHRWHEIPLSGVDGSCDLLPGVADKPPAVAVRCGEVLRWFVLSQQRMERMGTRLIAAGTQVVVDGSGVTVDGERWDGSTAEPALTLVRGEGWTLEHLGRRFPLVFEGARAVSLLGAVHSSRIAQPERACMAFRVEGGDGVEAQVWCREADAFSPRRVLPVGPKTGLTVERGEVKVEGVWRWSDGP